MGPPRALLIAVVLVAGCYQVGVRPPGDPDGGHDAGAPADHARAFVEARERELCRRAIECEPRNFDPSWAGAWCRPPDIDHWAERVASGAVRLDPIQAEECLRLLRGGAGCLESYQVLPDCNPFIDALPRGAPCEMEHSHCEAGLRCNPERCVCEPVIPIGGICHGIGDCGEDARCSEGTCTAFPVMRGTACGTTEDCGFEYLCTAEGCERELFCIDGSCEPADVLEAGDPCGGLLACGPNLGCRLVETTLVCDEPPGVGGDCSGFFSNPCRDRLNCVDDVCTPRPGEGEPCGFDVRCAPEAPYCVRVSGTDELVCRRDATGLECRTDSADGLVDTSRGACPRETHACVAPFRERFAQGTCQPIAGIGEPCSDPALCPMAARCVDGRCVHIVTPDQPCGPDAVCPVTHLCEDETCTLLPELGDRCDAAHPCYESVCIDGTCGRGAAGEPCTQWYECQFGCSDDGLCWAPAPEGAPCGCWVPGCAWCDTGLQCAWWLTEPVCTEIACSAP